jgi:3-phenylpropionate/cinnamic acid dioxygenase small subunit
MESDRDLIEGFLYREARLIDENAYDEWLSLWTDDAIYSVPCNSDDADPSLQVMIVYDDRRMLEDRIMRLKSGFARSQQSFSRMRRLISNVEFSSSSDGAYIAHSNFILAELRRSRQTIFSGHTIHTLRAAGGSFKIAAKTVLLLNDDEPIENLTFLV